MPADRSPRRVAQTGRYAPLFHRHLIPIVPFSPLKGVYLVKTLDCRQMEEQGADRVCLRVMQIVELRYGEPLYCCRIVSRIQVNIGISVPICGEKPLRGPMMFNPSSAACTTAPAIESDDKPAAPSPQPRAADAFKKLRRLLGFIDWLNAFIRHSSIE